MLILLAQVAVEFNRPRRTGGAHLHDLQAAADAGHVPGLVAAISDAVGELADGIAALLQP